MLVRSGTILKISYHRKLIPPALVILNNNKVLSFDTPN